MGGGRLAADETMCNGQGAADETTSSGRCMMDKAIDESQQATRCAMHGGHPPVSRWSMTYAPLNIFAIGRTGQGQYRNDYRTRGNGERYSDWALRRGDEEARHGDEEGWRQW